MADEEFLQLARQENDDDAGSTAVVALRIRNAFIIAHAGDSRALLCRLNSTGDDPAKGMDNHFPNVAESLMALFAAIISGAWQAQHVTSVRLIKQSAQAHMEL